jgi:hypothetical protein
MSLIDNIHSTYRQVLDSTYYRGEHKICLLDFIGAGDYFITDFGGIWKRSKVFPNYRGLVTKHFQPLVLLDRAFPYPWVQLRTTEGDKWFPVNQLLGWAFKPTTDKKLRYYLSSHPGVFPQDLKLFNWHESIPEVEVESRYKSYMEDLYKDVENSSM